MTAHCTPLQCGSIRKSPNGEVVVCDRHGRELGELAESDLEYLQDRGWVRKTGEDRGDEVYEAS